MERLKSLESNQRINVDIGAVSDEEEEEEKFQEAWEEEQIDPEEQRTLKLLKRVKGDQYKARVDLPIYGGNLNEEEFLD